MASGRIKGITIEIDGNTTKLTKALDGVDKSLKNTQTQLKDVDKLLKLNPGNMDLIRERSDLLNKSVGETKDRLKILNDALAEMDAKGVEKTSEEYRGLQREILATEENLSSLEKQAAQSNAAMSKISATASSVANGASKVASATKGLSTAAAGALTAMAGLGIKAAANADDLNTLSKQTGLTTETLQKFSYASDLIDVSLDDMTGALKKLKKNLTSNSSDVTETWDKLGVSVMDANGEFRDIESIFFDVVAAMGEIENETERDTVAMNLFGKSADNLAGILDDGGQALRELGKEAADRGVIVSQEDLDTANELNDTLDRLKATLSGSIGKAAVKLAQSLTPLIEKIANALMGVADVIASMSPETLAIIATVAAVIAAISPVAGIISGIATVISTVVPIIALLNATIAANPIVLIIAGIVAAIAALVAAGVALYKHWDEIKEKAIEIFNKIKDFFSKIFSSIKEAFSNFGTKIKDTWTNMITNIKEGFTGIIDKAKNWGKDLIDNIVNGIKNSIQKVKDAVSNIANTIKDFLGFSEPKKGPLSNFHTYMPDMIDLMGEGMKEGEKTLRGPLTGLAGSVKNTLVQNVTFDDSNITNQLSGISSMLGNKAPVSVNVNLQGDAKGIFRVVQQENARRSYGAGHNLLLN